MRQRLYRARPNAWITGPDPETHIKYRAFIQQRNQANFRNEDWQLTFDQWCDIWGDRYAQRGRRRGQLCLTRCDYELPWTVDNVEIMERRDHNRRQIAMMVEAGHKKWRTGGPK
jgi:hypothetical protein